MFFLEESLKETSDAMPGLHVFSPNGGGLSVSRKILDGEVTWDLEIVGMIGKVPADPEPGPFPSWLAGTE
jgi:hypothetical protein